MAKIEQTYIDQLLSRINIVDLIQGRIHLKKSGKNYQACCPFHKEKTPSFTVSEEKQFFHCFGCGEHGTSLGFLMKHDGMSFIEAVETLSQKTGMPMPEFNRYEKPKLAVDPYALLNQCCQFFQQQLNASSEASGYMVQRRIDTKITKSFRIGYAPDGWDKLLKHFADDDLKIGVLKELDMTSISRSESSKQYDRFRNRITFPIIDRRGRVIAFGARAVHSKDQPKYLNNSETSIFQKRNEVYGLYQCLQVDRNPSYLIVTEGYMDVIALHQAGIPQAVATMGTAMTVEQLNVLFRYTKTVILCFDGDEAGQKAAQRGLGTLLPHIKEEWRFKFVVLPQDTDPDKYIIEKGKNEFIERLDKSFGVLDFIKYLLDQSGDKNDLEDKPRLAQEAKKWITQTADNVWRATLIKGLSDHLEINSQYLSPNKRDSDRNATQNVTRKTRRTTKYFPSLLSLEHKFIAFILSYPVLVQTLDDQEVTAAVTLSPLVNQLIQVIKSNDVSTPIGVLIEQWNGTEDYEVLKKYLMWENPLNEEESRCEILNIVGEVNKLARQEDWQQLQQKITLYGEKILTQDEKKQYLGLLEQRNKPKRELKVK